MECLYAYASLMQWHSKGSTSRFRQWKYLPDLSSWADGQCEDKGPFHCFHCNRLYPQRRPIVLMSSSIFAFWGSTNITLHDLQFENILMYLIFVLYAAPLVTLCLKLAILAPISPKKPAQRYYSWLWAPLHNHSHCGAKGYLQVLTDDGVLWLLCLNSSSFTDGQFYLAVSYFIR